MKAFYCVGTHWDREWYKPFQEFRMWLVELIDELIDLMEKDKRYRCFHLDGQTVMLEDYLEIRPENRKRLLKLLKERRILAGPWYNLPDEWLISGESFIRNLMRGMRMCREMGFPHCDFAYTPDQFGHIAALPMIMNGFGLSAGICWRGTQDVNYPAQFVWRGPDDSRMVYHKLCDKGSYGPFDFAVRRPMKESGRTDKAFKDYFEPYFKEERERAPLPFVLMLDAIDHQRPDPEMPALLAKLQKRYPDIEFVWASLEEYGREIAQHADALEERTGELRQPLRDITGMYQYLIVHTISSRYPLKRRNGQCQALLEKWAEPYTLFEQLSGGTPISRYLEKAWEYLMRNHPHDSICGCSVDQVHRDMLYRFDQSEMIADGVTRRAMAAIGHASDALESWRNIVVHNPLPFSRNGVYDIAIEFPPDYPHKFVDGLGTGQMMNKFHLVKADGTRLPYQLKAIERAQPAKRLNDMGREMVHQGDICHVAVALELPPCGHTGFRVEPTDEATRNFGTLMTGPLSASNGLISITVNPNGTVSMRHEGFSRVFDGLFTYEDSGDAGDGWTRGPLVNDLVYRGPGNHVAVAVTEEGPLRATFRIEREFLLPQRLEMPAYRRSETRVAMQVTDFISVEKGSACLRVHTVVNNTVKDHRFRVLFPTNILTDTSFAKTPFAIVERDIAIPPETAHWQERVNPEKAFTYLCGVLNSDGGFAALTPWGLHEYEVFPTPDRTLALTLFRATGQTVMTSGEPDGQLQGTMHFDYQLWAFAGTLDRGQALRSVAEHQAGVRTHTAVELPEAHSFLWLGEGSKSFVTAIKPADDGRGGVIRLWNPFGVPRDERVYLCKKLKEAHRCNLNEEALESIQIGEDGGIPVTVPPRGLTTIRFFWE